MDTPVLFLILGESFQSFFIKYDISCGFFMDAFYYIEEVPFYAYSVRCFDHEGAKNVVKYFFFFHLLRWSCGF